MGVDGGPTHSRVFGGLPPFESQRGPHKSSLAPEHKTLFTNERNNLVIAKNWKMSNLPPCPLHLSFRIICCCLSHIITTVPVCLLVLGPPLSFWPYLINYHSYCWCLSFRTCCICLFTSSLLLNIYPLGKGSSNNWYKPTKLWNQKLILAFRNFFQLQHYQMSNWLWQAQ